MTIEQVLSGQSGMMPSLSIRMDAHSISTPLLNFALWIMATVAGDECYRSRLGHALLIREPVKQLE